jgi:hypothetical protein
MASIFENYFKNSLVGRGLSYLQDQQKRQQTGFVNEDGFIDAPRPSSSPVTSAGNIGSLGGADARAAGINPFAGSGVTVDKSPVEGKEGYTSSITRTGNFVIRDPSGRVIFSNNQYASDADAAAFVAASGKKEEQPTTTEVDTAADKVEDISQKTFGGGTGTSTAGTGTAAGAQAEYTKAKAESVGQAEDEAIEMIKKGRRATILTKPGGLLGTGEEEGQTRRRRALIGR